MNQVQDDIKWNKECIIMCYENYKSWRYLVQGVLGYETNVGRNRKRNSGIEYRVF